MARRTVYWHIGPDDLGTDFVAGALDVRRDDLAAAGVLVPGAVGSWELAAAEVRRTHAALGLRRAEVEGQIDALTRRIWRHKGVSVLSTPALAAASPDEIRLVLDGLRGAEIHLVLVVRDLTSQVYAGAQAALEGGATTRPATYAARVLDPDGEHPQAVAYRAGHDLREILRRWSRTVLPEHVHVLAETEPDAIWSRLMALVGVDDTTLPDGLGEPQLGPEALGVLREVAVTLDDRLDARGRRTALRDGLSRELLPRGGRFAPLDVAGRPQEWTAYIEREGFDMRGTISTSTSGSRGGPDAEASLTAALTDALVEVARLRQANDELAADNARLDRKRRKHKRRLRELNEPGAA